MSHGIETFYPSKTLINNFHRYPLAFFFPHDAHLSDTAQDIMTDIVAEKLSRNSFPETLNRSYISFIHAPHYWGDDKRYWFPRNCDIGTNEPDTPHRCRQVMYNDKPLVPSDESEVLIIGNSYAYIPMRQTAPSFPTLLASKISIGIQSCMIPSYGPVTTIIQNFFSSPKTMLSGKKIVILVMGTDHLLVPFTFNNIRQMDNYIKSIHGKKLIASYIVKSNVIDANGRKNLTSFRTKHTTVKNFFEIPVNGTITLAETAITDIDTNKPMSIVIPTLLTGGQFAKYIVNGQEITIPRSYGRHLNAFCELPVGTDRLKVEIVSKSGTILSIHNIQIYQ